MTDFIRVLILIATLYFHSSFKKLTVESSNLTDDEAHKLAVKFQEAGIRTSGMNDNLEVTRAIRSKVAC